MLTLAALALRSYAIDVPFHTGDFAHLPYKVSRYYGVAWIIADIHGPLLPLAVWFIAKVVVAAGGVMNETMWRLPLALVGTIQVPMTYFLMRRLRAHAWTSVLAAAIAAFLPSLASDARYPYGYVTLGVFMASLALWAWLRDLDETTRASRWLAGGLLGLYLLSHLAVYAVPIVIAAAALVVLGPRQGLRRLLRPSAVVPVVSAAAFTLFAFLMSGGGILGRVSRHVGFGTLDAGETSWAHLARLWCEHMGPIWSVLCAAGVAVGLVCMIRRDRRGLPALWVVVYIMPLLLVAKLSNIGRETSYVMQGTFAASLAGCMLLQFLVESCKPRPCVNPFSHAAGVVMRSGVVAFGVAIVAALLIGSVSNLFTPHRWPAFTGTVDYGRVVPDPGFKAAGWYIQQHVPEDALILATHGLTGLEYPCATYYTCRHIAATEDTTYEQERQIIDAVRGRIDVAIVEPRFLPEFRREYGFTVPVRILREGRPILYIAARTGFVIPSMDVEVAEANRRHDRTYRLARVPTLVRELPRTAEVNQIILALRSGGAAIQTSGAATASSADQE
jgi:hypothetical protein